ncbi:hypothetical protein [Lactiplantibacillus plantarum]|uniref:hypothetical protein n=1 Tax=Lactiplantibacillus plantarum TaxID=1590 RepID=UPI003F533CFA
MDINAIVASLIVVGGLGFINYNVADRQGLVDFRGPDSKMQIPYMLCWSIFDFAIYLIVQDLVGWLKNTSQVSKNKLASSILMGDSGLAISLLVTIILVFFISVFSYRPFSEFVNWLNNKRRNKNNKASLFVGNPWTGQFITNKEKMIFVFDFEHNPIVSGYLTKISTNPQDLQEMSIMPFNDNSDLATYKDIIEGMNEQRDKYHVMQYVDYDKKLLIISAETIDDVK